METLGRRVTYRRFAEVACREELVCLLVLHGAMTREEADVLGDDELKEAAIACATKINFSRMESEVVLGIGVCLMVDIDTQKLPPDEELRHRVENAWLAGGKSSEPFMRELIRLACSMAEQRVAA